ncbi:hypothetical protein [Spirosoma montaniterrae]|uniref:Uncharacterized protein n=1 Tax=Spirosoma montaniterrae TaxID=1178516 RepID=A0A1P9WS74_9BACT|nr:hypothetical protein [Spirosoma montaniterrae]AQG78236.1 hypothetical protein AWR27_02070 [Spirosoma montaniterrae]
MRSFYRFIGFVFLLLLIGLGESCRSDEATPAPDDTAYFPLQVGDSWIYWVTQQTYSVSGNVVERTFQLQQKVIRSFSQNGQPFFIIEESIRNNDRADWQINAIRTVYKNPAEVVVQDNNVPKRRLLFPITTATSWNVNAYNASPDTLLRYEALNQPFRVGTRQFDQTVTVVGRNDSTLVDLNRYRQVYALNIGLVYQENESLAFCQTTPDCIGKGIIASGRRQRWSLLTSNRLP